MSVEKIDCRGMSCPLPVLETKKALEKMTGNALVTIVDNRAALENVSQFARNAGYEVATEEKDGHYYITITPKGRDTAPQAKEHPQKTTYLICSNTLGEGSPDLGQTLMKSFILTLAEGTDTPSTLLFLNSGVFLTCRESPVLPHLEKLAAAGVTIISCTTCLDYYKLREKLAVGRASNMYEIVEHLREATKVITIT